MEKKVEEELKINQPKISDETMREMAKFFMKTSIPRILADMKKKEGEKNELLARTR